MSVAVTHAQTDRRERDRRQEGAWTGKRRERRTGVDPARDAHVPVVDADAEVRRELHAQDVVVRDAVPSEEEQERASECLSDNRVLNDRETVRPYHLPVFSTYPTPAIALAASASDHAMY